MRARSLSRLLTFFASVALLASAGSADAQLFRTYLASDGADGNPCTLSQPCRLLPAALALVVDGGEIWILDSANFNTGTVAITKSVSILAIPGAVGSIVANGGHAITISGAGSRVTLRNLVFGNLAGAGNNGVHMTQGVSLTVLDSYFGNLTGSGVNIQSAGTKVQVIGSTFNGNTVGVRATAGILELANVNLLNNSTGVQAGGSGGANQSPPNGPTRVRIHKGNVLGNGIAFHMDSAGTRLDGSCNGSNIFLAANPAYPNILANTTFVLVTGASDVNPGCTTNSIPPSIGSYSPPLP